MLLLAFIPPSLGSSSIGSVCSLSSLLVTGIVAAFLETLSVSLAFTPVAGATYFLLEFDTPTTLKASGCYNYGIGSILEILI